MSEVAGRVSGRADLEAGRAGIAAPSGGVVRAAARKFSVLSLFSGCGGMDLGFTGGFRFLGRNYRRLPFRVVWANDIDPAACATYRANLGGDIVCGDVRDHLADVPSADVVIGGFPCQDVSINGKGLGENGARTTLYDAMIRVVRRARPRVFVAENVRGLLLARHEGLRRDMLAGFARLGYEVDCRLYLAADYGVPQMRERVFIVGARRGEKPFAPPAAPLSRDDWITARAALADLEPQDEGAVANHIWSKAKRGAEQGNRTLKADRPAATIRAECHGHIQFHYALDRRISMREAARCQSFPDWFTFNGGIRQIERQIGNAVPPALAWHIAGAALDALT